ncbi:MAG: oligosaccharide flippase family protein, partial [Anaeroplasmataceae bacterium]|nr:oligosaccharide flippase family protein [Anaeroplasmataceae bacterium]
NYLLTLWYIFTYRKIIFGKMEKLKETFKEVFSLIKIGLPLLFANLSATLILTLDRQVVNMLFSNADYAVYAFAYNMLSLVTVAISAISTVIYPTLKRTSEETLKDNYSRLITIVLIFVNLTLCSYYPLCFIIDWILPKYLDSLVIFRIIFPGLAISSCITVIMHNYYKILGENKIYFIKSLIIIALSLVANIGAYFIRKSMLDISIASIIVMIFWNIFIERHFVKKFNIKWVKNFIYMLIMVVYFYLITFIENYYLGFALHCVSFVLITGLYYFMELKQIIKKYKEKKDKKKISN